MKKLHLIFLTLSFFISKIALSQPDAAIMNYNLVSIQTDSGVFIDNIIWDYYSSEIQPDSITHCVRSKNHYHAIAISPENLIENRNEKKALKINLKRDSLTMNIILENIMVDSIDYVIQYIPFKEGKYFVLLPENLKNEAKIINANDESNRVVIVGAIIESYDITPFVKRKIKTPYNNGYK